MYELTRVFVIPVHFLWLSIIFGGPVRPLHQNTWSMWHQIFKIRWPRFQIGFLFLVPLDLYVCQYVNGFWHFIVHVFFNMINERPMTLWTPVVYIYTASGALTRQAILHRWPPCSCTQFSFISRPLIQILNMS